MMDTNVYKRAFPLFWFLLLIASVKAQKIENDEKRPIFIFSGLASNRLMHYPGTSCWVIEQVWLPPTPFIYTWCWQNVMKLRFDNDTNEVTDYDSEIFIDMNSTTTMEDVLGVGTAGYVFKDMVDGLVSLGFVRQKNIFGIPQDWRKSIKDRNLGYYGGIQALIREKTLKIGKKSTLVCHSYGCINLAELIRLFDPADLDPYIGDIITIGAPWGGSMDALRALMSGVVPDTKLGIFRYEDFQEIQRTHTSLVHLIPVREVLKYPDFVHIAGQHYTRDNISIALNISRVNTDMLRTRSDIDSLVNAFDKLNNKTVTITNIIGSDVPTLARLNYSDSEYISNRKLSLDLSDRGDGTVADASASLICKKSYVKDRCISLPNVNHLGLIKLEFVWKLVANKSTS